MKWTIDKRFDFCYGHRVHNQTLNAEFSVDACLACRHLHGHQGEIKILLQGDELSNGMVTDFKHMNWFKVFLDDVLDHKFIMDINDPLLAHEVPDLIKFEHFSGTTNVPKKVLDFGLCLEHLQGYWTPNINLIGNLDQAVYEKYEGMVFVDFVPTSENLSAWLLRIARNKMVALDVKVVAVEFWETPKSHCRVDV